MNRYKVAIIGLGQISSSYKHALETLDHYELIAVCDINKNAKSKIVYENYPFYTNYQDMINAHSIDIVIIATPPNTHKKIAVDIMNHNINVLLEKPAVLHIDDLLFLNNLSHKKNVFMDTIFHWEYSNEVLFIKKRYPNIDQSSFIQTKIYDPYTKSKKYILKDRISLQGAWLDSGVNVLSMINQLVSLESFKLSNRVSFIDPKSKLPYYVHQIFNHPSITLDITVNWRTQKNYKETLIKLMDKDIKIIHHLETVYENNRLIYQSNVKNRLSQHYYNFFSKFDPNQIDIKKNILIHQILLTGEYHEIH